MKDNNEYNYQEIYPDTDITSQQVIIEYIESRVSASEKICVFGVLDSEAGRKIKDEMLSWLLPEYNVYCIILKEPGELYEYPALRFSQWLCMKKGSTIEYLLYVHTKGAVFKNPTQKKIRDLWKHEFTGQRAEEYIKEIQSGSRCDVVCLLTGPNNQTWYNGMFISHTAFDKMSIILSLKDRYVFQRLFSKGFRVKGMLGEHISADRLTDYTIGLFKNIENKNSRDYSGNTANDYSVSVEWKLKKK